MVGAQKIQTTSAPIFELFKCVSVSSLDHQVSQLLPGDYFVVDVDDTLIATQAMMFRPHSPFYEFIDKLKKQSPKNVADIISTWRLNRKSILVEPQWPEILRNLRNRGVTVLALTQVNTGSFGKIASVEKWRAAELNQMQLNFSPYAVHEIETIIEHNEPATLFQGILFTGTHSKANVLEAFINKYQRPTRVMFFDDRLHQVENIFEFCKTANIPYNGYHYLGATQLPYKPEMDLGAIQTQMILNQEWAEDDQIQKN
ncbi:MAG: DUF2608 domain-containing protein [Proteobacteria bacterium]|nr:DUF2608 domain-containing protein [Pseudomonadota bacterium]